MAKEKFFSPEDFDKPKDQSFWLRFKGWILGIGALLIIAAIVLWCAFADKEKRQLETNEQEHAESIVSNDHKVESLAVTVNETHEEEALDAVNEETESSSPSVRAKETPKADTKEEVDNSQPITHADNISSNVEQEALKVIRGEYGNIPERREKLGNKYQEIQNKVNQLKKEGVF